jgi:hypothetical protein
MKLFKILTFLSLATQSYAYSLNRNTNTSSSGTTSNRRAFLKTASWIGITGATVSVFGPKEAHAIGPVKISLNPIEYSARVCPPDRPIPGKFVCI